MAEIRKRTAESGAGIPATKLGAGTMTTAPALAKSEGHPSGKEGHGRLMQVLRGVAFALYFSTCIVAIAITQIAGAPLYFVNREWYYAYMASTKRSFAITTASMTRLWGPTTIRISGDESVATEIKKTADGSVAFKFPERMVLIANHQIYTDWLYLWWIGYRNVPRMDGHLYIILKESLQWIPFIGMGMRFYGFIFMSRKMEKDQSRMAYRLNKLQQKKVDAAGKSYFDPMWLLLFPEGTNLSNNGRAKSAAWAEKKALKDPEHLMLPRSTGTFFCLNELKGTVDWVYDCTVAYEGVGRGQYGEELFGLSSTYFEGKSPKSVNFYWRRFRIADIPLDDPEKFELWLRDQWYRKDALIEEYLTTGRFPRMADAEVDFVEAAVKTQHAWEILQVFTVVGVLGLIVNNIRKAIHAVALFRGT